MKKMEKVIKLYASCVPVKGASRSLICDLMRNDYDFIPNSLYDLLIKYEACSVEKLKTDFPVEEHQTIDEYLDFLIAREYIFFTHTPERFPRMSFDWESPYTVTNALVDFNHESNHNLVDIVSQLSTLGCQAIELRFFDEIKLPKLRYFLNHTCNSSLRAVNLLVKYSKSVSIASVERLFIEPTPLTTVTIHSWPADLQVPETRFPIYVTVNNINSESHCGAINEYLFNVNIPLFTESKHFNNCLNRKIGIDANGLVKNCPSQQRQFGNASKVRLAEIVELPEFKKLWSIKKDEVEVCKDCEFRYICTDCRVFVTDADNIYSKPGKCTYNPYEGMHDKI